MAKTWDRMTTEEKVEDLRQDMKKTMAAVEQIKKFSGMTADGVSELFAKLEQIEKRLPAKKASKA